MNVRQSSLDLPPAPKPNVVETLTYEHRLTFVAPRMMIWLFERWGEWNLNDISNPKVMVIGDWLLDQTKGGHEIAFEDHFDEVSDPMFPDQPPMKLPTFQYVVTVAFERQEDAALFKLFHGGQS